MKKKFQHIGNSKILLFSISTAAGIIASAVVLILSALFLSKNSLPFSYHIFFWFPIYIAGALTCGFISARLSSIKGILSGLISSSLYYAVITLILLILNDFSFSNLIILMLPLSVICGIISGILAANLR